MSPPGTIMDVALYQTKCIIIINWAREASAQMVQRESALYLKAERAQTC